MQQLVDVIIGKAQALGYRHELHRFPSGAVMIDVFKTGPGEAMLVFQILEDRIGISIVNDDWPALTTVPDETFFDVSPALVRIEQVLG